jgi:SAM-dependent methyltransferase
MEKRDLRIAAEFCALVESANLFEYLGLERSATAEEARASLAKKRKYMQSMQNNPKFKDSAKFLIKNFRVLDRVLESPVDHLKEMRLRREKAMLPTLVMVLDAVLSDGHMSAPERVFTEGVASEMGISGEAYEAALLERSSLVQATVEGLETPTGPKVSGSTVVVESVEEGQTARLLQGASGHGWWDATFTRMLLECIPGGPGELVDVYCRTALSAMTLLPDRRQLTYLGVDRSSERLRVAKEALRAQSHQHAVDRITLTVGEPHSLPIDDASVDYVLAIRALANLSDTRPVLAEAYRVLRPGGRLIVAEPDGLSECFYFDGHLRDYNAAFHRLCHAFNEAQGAGVPAIGRPGIAIGPSLPARMKHAGFQPTKVQVHASYSLKAQPFGRLLRRLQKYPSAMAGNAGLTMTAVHASVLKAVKDLEAELSLDRIGMAGHVLPLFLAVGEKG